MITDNRESLSLTMGPDSCNVKDRVVPRMPEHRRPSSADWLSSVG